MCSELLIQLKKVRLIGLPQVRSLSSITRIKATLLDFFCFETRTMHSNLHKGELITLCRLGIARAASPGPRAASQSA
ncbi:hypothetical protein E2C01_012670 [Portunus trituberculatus]|uniref:Uncharacterized protein n=1 Tax=Portunus trituberculatus TaxID=210409 RepID=A0A5B7DFC3_PORTR|nr:hypothetical protein [Portunus trituberculatus]